MRVLLKPGILVLTPESQAELQSFTSWCGDANGHVFHLVAHEQGTGAALHDLGTRSNACREPLNIAYQVDAKWQAISNLSLSPFYLDKRHYASIEGFWQGLKFDDEADRRRIARLYGLDAKHAGDAARAREHFLYEGAAISVGATEHWALMERACRAKFETHGESKEALLATGDRWLTHRMPRDSRNIPGVIMADIWMRIRESLQAAEAGDVRSVERLW